MQFVTVFNKLKLWVYLINFKDNSRK